MPYVQVDGLKIYYEISGQGFPLLLLHGMSNNAQSWTNQLTALQSRYTVIAWDAPGYGLSSDPSEELRSFKQFAAVLQAFVEQLGYESIYLLGHSMGAAIAIEFCANCPQKVKALILADATRGAAALSEEENDIMLQNRLISIETLSPSEIANKRVDHLLAPQASQEVRQQAMAIMSQIRPMGYRSVAFSLSNAHQMELIRSISTPTLIVYGEMDRVTTVSEAMIFHENIQGSQLRIIPNTGHLCYQEDPEAFNQIIMDFIE